MINKYCQFDVTIYFRDKTFVQKQKFKKSTFNKYIFKNTFNCTLRQTKVKFVTEIYEIFKMKLFRNAFK